MDVLPNILSMEQKKRKIKYLLETLAKEGLIRNAVKGANAEWEIVKK